MLFIDCLFEKTLACVTVDITIIRITLLQLFERKNPTLIKKMYLHQICHHNRKMLPISENKQCEERQRISNYGELRHHVISTCTNIR